MLKQILFKWGADKITYYTYKTEIKDYQTGSLESVAYHLVHAWEVEAVILTEFWLLLDMQNALWKILKITRHCLLSNGPTE